MIQATGIVWMLAACMVAADDAQPQQLRASQRTVGGAADATLAKVVARQQAKDEKLRHELQVYVRDEQRIYVNGTQVSLELLKKIVRKTKARKVVLSAEPHVTWKRMAELTSLMQQENVDDLLFKVVKPDGKEAKRKKKAKN